MCTQTDRVIIDVDSGGVGGLTGQYCTSITFKLALKTIDFKEDVMFRIEKRGAFYLTLNKAVSLLDFFKTLLSIDHEKCLSGMFNSFRKQLIEN